MPAEYETGRATHAEPETTQTRADLADFVGLMLADFHASGADEWENGTLGRFLDGLQAVLVDGVAPEELNSEHSSWRMFAQLLASASGYE